VGDVSGREPDPSVTLLGRPDDAWLRIYQREIPVDVLTAVIDGELVFGVHPGVAVARAAVTDAPDGSRWVGLSAVRTADDQSAAGPAARLCEALLTWGAQRGATRGYMRVHDADMTALAESVGFRLHHRARYFLATAHGIPRDSL
jgi:hypothetical protein